MKAYGGDHGFLEVTGRARGTLQSWQKWSFPLGPHSTGAGLPGRLDTRAQDPPGQPLRPSRRQAVTVDPAAAGRPACSVELAQARADGEAWWTIGFEATGPAGSLRAVLRATAALVFDQPLPGRAELSLGNSSSYPHWFTRHASPG